MHIFAEMEALYFIIGLVVGACAVLLAVRGTRRAAKAERKSLEDIIAGKDAEITKQAEGTEALRSTLQEKSDALVKAETGLRFMEDSFAALKKDLEDARGEITESGTECRALTGQCEALRKEVELLKKNEAEAETKLRKVLDVVQEKMTNVTHELLKKSSSELEENNSKSMENIITPLKDKLKALSDLVNDSREKSVENTAAMSQQIKDLMERTREIGDEATRLTNALTKRPQFQGSMGETILGNILQNAGLQSPRDYEEQVTMKDSKGNVLLSEESGRRMRPDVILHFPDNRDAIIDAKVSLTAYEKYVNAETEAERGIYLKEHIASMRSHVDELVGKKYNDYISKPHTTIDFVIMFVPFEGALQTALLNDPQLWSEAFCKNVCIVGELNLTVILKMINMTWKQFEQSKNQEEVYEQAQLLINRVGLFCERFEKMAKSIEGVKTAYDSCYTTLHGKQNMLLPARRIVELGGKDDKRLPSKEEIIAEAETIGEVQEE